MSQHQIEFRQFDIEFYFARRLRAVCDIDIFDGITTTESRRGAIREAIQTHSLARKFINAKGKKPETWKHAFERLFEEPLNITEAA
jgi:hypothetical protein